VSEPIKRPAPGISPNTTSEDWGYLNDKQFAEKERAFRKDLREGGVDRGKLWY
jgi:hypothetical protein